jgi:hypothetical protein
MRSIHVSALSLACAAVVLGGGASAPAKRASESEKVCINRREINAISALDDRHAFVKVSASQFYLATLDKSCREFGVARTIVIERSRVRVCGDGNTLLSFEVPTVGAMRCRIEQLESVANKAEARDLIESRATRE